MKHRKLKNVAASIQQRLLNEARASSRPFHELLQYFAMERFLYRLSKSCHRETFILKGALMLAAWKVSPTRPTKDIDLLGYAKNDVEGIVRIVQAVCGQTVAPDGLNFDSASVRGQRIADEAEYKGVRVRFQAKLGAARVSMQIDVGFGDAVVPGPVTASYPTILDLPAPSLRGYTRESVVAEKFHAMVRRGALNSRMRDFFDVWVLSRQFDFDGRVLAAALRETFARRGLQVDPRTVALKRDFATGTTKAAQWRGFLRTSRLEDTYPELAQVVAANAVFLGLVATALHDEREFLGHWTAPGPWILP